MPVKTITHSITGQRFKLGRNQPGAPRAKLSLREMTAVGALPQVIVPKTTNYSAAAAPSLRRVYKNDEWGCCVISGGFHQRGISSFNSGAGRGALFSDDEVESDYHAIGGFDPSQTQPDGSNPTDNGCNENTALAYWKTHGFPDGVKLYDSMALDATKISEVELAQYLMENLFFGLNLPDAWVDPMPSASGFVWDVAGEPNPENGHCVIGADLTSDGIKIATWGMEGIISYAAVEKYASNASGGQLFSLLTPDIVTRISHKSPNQFDLPTLDQFLRKAAA